jgi:hypothetical protein
MNILDIKVPHIPKQTLPPINGGSFTEKGKPFQGRLIVHFHDQSKELFCNATLLRENYKKSIWITFYGKVICLKNVKEYDFVF